MGIEEQLRNQVLVNKSRLVQGNGSYPQVGGRADSDNVLGFSH